jgi:hypothetical protein
MSASFMISLLERVPLEVYYSSRLLPFLSNCVDSVKDNKNQSEWRILMNLKKKELLLILPLLALSAMACVLSGPRLEIGRLQTMNEVVELNGNEAIVADIEMGAGELTIGSGASELMEARFRFNVEEMQPEIEFDSDRLRVITPSVDIGFDSLWDIDDYQNEWDLTFNDGVEIAMYVDVGAGSSQLDLGDLQLTELHVDAGAGETRVDLSGSQYLTELSIDAGVGELSIDMRGNWAQGLRADLRAGVGSLTLWLPSETGVQIEVDGGITDIDTTGLDRNGRIYTNDAFSSAGDNLVIHIDAGVGSIDLIVSE